MADLDVIRWLTDRFTEKSRSLFVYLKGIGHWRPRESPDLVAAVFAIADDDRRHAAMLAEALDGLGVPPPPVCPADYSHLHYMRPEFLIPVCIKARQESLALYSRPEIMAYPVIAPIAAAIADDERRHLQTLHELHRKASSAAVARAAAQAADPV